MKASRAARFIVVAGCRLAILIVAFILLAPILIGAKRLGLRWAVRIPVLFHRLFLRLFGVRVTTNGRPPVPATPTLILANHVSWLDIPLIGATGPLGFIAKSEIAGWPVVGTLARLQGSVFLDRARKAGTASANAEVAKRLSAGEAVLLFPEGTTGDGIRLLPFRSSLVGAARAALTESGLSSVLLQPLAIRYTRRDGLPLGLRDMPAIAWYGDMELGPAIGDFLRGGPWDATVSWGEPVRFDRASDRKAVTAAMRAEVGRLLEKVGTRRCS